MGKSKEVIVDQWKNCYEKGWGKNIVPGAFSHPAKVNFSLAGKIYNHVINEGWVKRGETVLDPFGGIAGFGYHALYYGLNFVAVELEQKFVDLGRQNIELWNRQLKGWHNLGTARIVQGDSRRLKFHMAKMIGSPDLVVSSPPYSDCNHNLSFKTNEDKEKFAKGHKLAKMGRSIKAIKGSITFHDYGHTPGNLANLPEGKFEMVVGSPPFSDCERGGTGVVKHPSDCHCNYCKKNKGNAGNVQGGKWGLNTEGQLGSMPEGSFDLIASSPLWEDTLTTKPEGKYGLTEQGLLSNGKRRGGSIITGDYGNKEGQLGNSSGDTFWSASREILQGCHDLLKPGGYAIWVCKDYIKSGKRVPFSDRWFALCESVGFKLICRHRAMLVKEYKGLLITTKKEKKSFFRRLHEKRFPDLKIDWEDVLCLEKR